VAPGLPAGEVAGFRGFPLAARHVFDAGAIDLRRVGAVVQAEADDAGDQRRERQAEVREDVEEEIELDEQRRAPHEFGEAGSREADQRVRRAPRDG